MKFLGVDYGTTSVKAALFDEKLNQLSSETVDYTLITKGETVEFQAQSYWDIFKELLGRIEKPDCLAIDTQCETMILTDENGEPLRNAIVWLDNRATKEAEEIEKHFGRKKVYEVTGQPEITATWPASKLLWIKKNEPEVWKKTKKIFLLEDYILYKLTGKFVTEKTLQSSTIYFDIKKSCWWKEMLDFIGISEDMLPQLYDSGKYVGDYDGIKVCTSAMDQVAGAVGAGVVKEGLVSEMTGTTMAIFSPCSKVPEYDENSIVPCHYNYDGKYCVLSWSPTAGMALKWLRNTFLKDVEFKELDKMAENVPAGSGGVTFLPYLCGSTMPKYNPDAKASFTGITAEHTAAHFVRSVMESVAFMLKSNLDYLGADVKEIRAMGGAANSRLWCQMKSDLTKKNLVTLKNKETSCLGSAIFAAIGAGYIGSVEEAASMIMTDKVYEPAGTDYSKAYESFLAYDRILNVKK